MRRCTGLAGMEKLGRIKLITTVDAERRTIIYNYVWKIVSRLVAFSCKIICVMHRSRSMGHLTHVCSMQCTISQMSWHRKFERRIHYTIDVIILRNWCDGQTRACHSFNRGQRLSHSHTCSSCCPEWPKVTRTIRSFICAPVPSRQSVRLNISAWNHNLLPIMFGARKNNTYSKLGRWRNALAGYYQGSSEKLKKKKMRIKCGHNW